MDVKQVIFETLWESPSSLLPKLKWSFEISLKNMLDRPQKEDMPTVFELMEKSSVDCLKLTIEILNDLPRLDLVHKLSQADLDPENKCTVLCFPQPDTKIKLKQILKTLKSLTFAEYSKFILFLENELVHIWKQRLDGADLLQVVELMELLFSQDPAVLTQKALKKMGRHDLESKLSNLISATKDTSDALEHICKTLSCLKPRKFRQFKDCLEMYLPHIPVSELREADCQSTVDLMETNSFQNCVESTEKVLERMERPDLVYKLSHNTSANTEKMDIKKHIWKALRGLGFEELRLFKDCLRMNLPHIPLSQLEKANCKEVVEMMELNIVRQCVEKTQKVLKWIKRSDLEDKLSDLTSRTSEIMTTKACIWETLKDLCDTEFNTFSCHLKMFLPQIPESQLNEADFQSIVRLMERSLIRNFVKITQKALREINRLDLLRTLSDVSLQDNECTFRLLSGKIFEQSIRLPMKKEDLRPKNLTERQNNVFSETSGHSSLQPLQPLKSLESLESLESLDPLEPLNQRVEVMESVIAGLLDTLGGLSDVELRMFQKKLPKLKHLQTTPSLNMEPQEVVFWIVQRYGQQSLEIVVDVFTDMCQTDVAQRLRDRCSGHEKNQLSSVMRKVALAAAVKELLLDTAHYLSSSEMCNIEWFIQFTCFQRGISWIDLNCGRVMSEGFYVVLVSTKAKYNALINALVKKHGRQSLAVMRDVFLNMNRPDLAQSLETGSAAQGAQSTLYHASNHPPHTYSYSDPEQRESGAALYSLTDSFTRAVSLEEPSQGQPSVYRTTAQTVSHIAQPVAIMSPEQSKKVKEMVGVINLLINTLGHLNTEELMELTRTMSTEPYYSRPRYRMFDMEMQYVVFFFVQTYGQWSVEITKSLLGSIGRTDLEQMLLKSNPASKDDSPDVWMSGLVQKVATIAVVSELLKETLKKLSYEDLKRFKKLFLLNFLEAPRVDMILLAGAEAESTGTLLLETYGSRAVGMANWVLNHMNRTDLANMLPYRIHNPTRNEPTDLREVLCNVLGALHPVEADKLKWMLQLTYFTMGLECIPSTPREGQSLADLIMETSGQQALKVIKEVLEDMNRLDLLSFAPAEDSMWTALKPEETSTEEHWSSECTGGKSGSFSQNLNESTKMEKLLVVLQDLNEIEKKPFQKHLQILCEKNLSTFFVNNYMRMFPDPGDLVELLVAVYGESRSVDMIETVLKKEIGRGDLVEKVSMLCCTSTESQELGSWTTNKLENKLWTKLEPEVKKINTDEKFTYSLQSEAGSYECSVSGLRWTCKGKVCFQFIFGSWEEHIERIEALQYFPAGPLIDLKMTSGKLEEVYLPHWICIDNPNIKNGLAVLHINDCGDVVEKVTEVTPNHVKLSEPIFSPRAVLMRNGFPVKIYCSVLIYKTNLTFLTLNVYLVPRDQGLLEAIDKREKEKGHSIIQKPHPDESLKMKDKFVLRAELKAVTIEPNTLRLRYLICPNFFEVYIENPNFNFKLELAREDASVWSCTIRQADYTCSAQAVSVTRAQGKTSMTRAQGIQFVERFRTALIQRVNNVPQILDHLHAVGVVSAEEYATIRAQTTNQEQMRTLFSGPLNASGDNGKYIFYKILKETERYLCDELESS